MKTLHLAITIFAFVLTAVLFQFAYGSQCPPSGYIHYGPSRQSVPCYLVLPPPDPTLEDQLGDPTKIVLVHHNAILVLNQTINKTSYKSGEEITIIPELTNIGNQSVDIAYWEPPFFLEIKNQTGDVLWPQDRWVTYIPEFYGIKTLNPGEKFSENPWAASMSHFPGGPHISLTSPGNYTAISVATLTFDTGTNDLRSLEPLWSKPLPITILQENYIENETKPNSDTNSTVIQSSLANCTDPYPSGGIKEIEDIREKLKPIVLADSRVQNILNGKSCEFMAVDMVSSHFAPNETLNTYPEIHLKVNDTEELHAVVDLNKSSVIFLSTSPLVRTGGPVDPYSWLSYVIMGSVVSIAAAISVFIIMRRK